MSGSEDNACVISIIIPVKAEQTGAKSGTNSVTIDVTSVIVRGKLRRMVAGRDKIEKFPKTTACKRRRDILATAPTNIPDKRYEKTEKLHFGKRHARKK